MAASLSAAFNVEEHEAKYGTPAGPSVIVEPLGGKLPYLPGMREIANDNDAHRERDPVGQCHMHGVPRVMFPPFPLEILQDGPYVVILTETEHGVRIIPTPGHTAGHQSFVVDTQEGRIVIAGQAFSDTSDYARALYACRLDREGAPHPEYAPWVARLEELDPWRVTFAHDLAIWQRNA